MLRLAKKSQPLKAIKLASQLIKQDSSCRSAAAKAAIHGLEHEAPDVQEQVIEFLESVQTEITPDLQKQILASSDHVAAVLRPRLDGAGDAAAGEGITNQGTSKPGTLPEQRGKWSDRSEVARWGTE